jgi:hypothetical protein
MSADRRTLVVAAGAMVVLVAVGVVGAALFTRSACEGLEPEAVPPGISDGDTGTVLAEAFDDVDAGVVARLVDRLEALAGGQPLPGLGRGGHLAGAVEVGAATGLTGLGEGIAVTGERLTATAGPGEVASAVALDEETRVVGDGDHLYALAIANELTGQIDGIVPLDADLSGGECLDTAQVGVPLPFHLDAGGGQLLLFRIDDDGEGPEVEVRDPDGTVWSEPIELGGGPPGVLAERLTGRLGGDTVVTARRSLPDDDAPAIQAWGGDDGAVRWTRTAAELDGLAPAGDQALEVDVVDVTDELALVALSREERTPVLLVALELEAGRPLWTSDLDAAAVPRAAGSIDGEVVLVAPRGTGDEDEERTFEVVRLDPSDGRVKTLHSANGHAAAATVVGPRVVLAVDRAVTRIDPDGQQHTVELPVPVRDLHAVDGQLAILVRGGDQGALVWARL